MIADPKTSFEGHSLDQLPASSRVYVQGQIHPDVQVPMREIKLSPTKDFNGRIIENDPVRVYDCSGPWGDPDYKGTVETGLPGLRKQWILDRGDVEAYEGREIEPRDNGYLTANHAEYAAAKREGLLSPLKAPINAQRQPLKAKPGQMKVFRELTKRFIERTQTESKVLYYGFCFNGDEAHCREGYVGADGLLEHLQNVGELIAESAHSADIVRLEVHGNADELAKLREPLKDMPIQWFTLESGFRR